jgi:hypothetical protein
MEKPTAARPIVLGATIVATAAFFLCGAGARTQELSSCTSSIEVLINRYNDARIATNSTIWFSSVLESVHSTADDLAEKPVRIDVRQSRITFGKWPYVIAMPDSTILLDPSTREVQRWWVGAQRAWSLTYAPSQIPEAFFDGMPFRAPEPFIPGDSGPITWTATFTASRPGITLAWAWSAAVYSQFGANGALLVKPLTAPVLSFQNGDPAGTPEIYKQYVISGAMGKGVRDYTGARSESASVTACPVSTPPPMTRAQPAATPGQAVTPRISVRFAPGAPSFASAISQVLDFDDGSQARSVDRCYATDLCALISYADGGQLAIYSEGAAYCRPYILHFDRMRDGRSLYAFSRALDHDDFTAAHGRRCARARITRITMDGGRIKLTISTNADGTLRFQFKKG